MNCHECYCNVLSQPPCYPCLNCNHYDSNDCALDCQECTYDHDRTGPFKLEDGMWSDGVDRRFELSLFVFAVTNQNRIHVIRGRYPTTKWFVWRGIKRIKGYSTHAEAIAYADKVARE